MQMRVKRARLNWLAALRFLPASQDAHRLAIMLLHVPLKRPPLPSNALTIADRQRSCRQTLVTPLRSISAASIRSLGLEGGRPRTIANYERFFQSRPSLHMCSTSPHWQTAPASGKKPRPRRFALVLQSNGMPVSFSYSTRSSATMC